MVKLKKTFHTKRMSTKLSKKIKALIKSSQQFADRSWYPPLIALLAALDNLIIIIPNDGILVASAMLIPKRWHLFSIFITIGSTLGAVLLGYLVQLHGLPWILDFYPGLNETQMWLLTQNFFNQYGLLVVFAVAASPLMQHPAIILASLTHTPLAKLALVIFSGRLIKYILMGYVASHSPHYLKRFWGIKDELDDVGVKID